MTGPNLRLKMMVPALASVLAFAVACSSGSGNSGFDGGQSGGSTGSGGAGGSGGGTNCEASCAVLTGCCPGMPMSECLAGCNAGPPSDACAACFNDTACGALGLCVVAECGVPESYCAATSGGG